jgi:hypothetical protein
VTVAKLEASGGVLRKVVEEFFATLQQGLDHLDTGGLVDGADANALGRAIINAGESAHRIIDQRGSGGRVGAPQLVRFSGDDPAFLCLGGCRREQALWGEQRVLTHQSRHSRMRGTNSPRVKPHPEDALAFAMERRVRGRLADEVH